MCKSLSLKWIRRAAVSKGKGEQTAEENLFNQMQRQSMKDRSDWKAMINWRHLEFAKK